VAVELGCVAVDRYGKNAGQTRRAAHVRGVGQLPSLDLQGIGGVGSQPGDGVAYVRRDLDGTAELVDVTGAGCWESARRGRRSCCQGPLGAMRITRAAGAVDQQAPAAARVAL
jgi:hypothetical protein